MKFLILGSDKKAGHMIAIYLSENGHDVTCLEKAICKDCKSLNTSIYDRVLIQETITQDAYNAVVYCDTIVNDFAENDKEAAVYINAYLPHLLAKLTCILPTKVISVSTDCVFSGRKGRYSEFDFRDGESFYARTKALGELYDDKNFTIRTSLVGPDINKDGIGLLNWFMKQSKQVKGYTRAMWTGITTLELAKIIEQVAKQDAAGLENMVNNHIISKYDLLTMFSKNFKDGTVQIIADDNYIVDKSLIRGNRKINYEIPDYDIMFQELANWLKNHQEDYPHYYL